MVSNPTEQLIHDLSQERAKAHHERVRRLKAQQEEQRKAGEAHQKKQLEYIRSTGIKLNEFEKDQAEDARKLKSLLERGRPSLISRPSKGAQDTKYAADWAARLVNLGQIVAPSTGFLFSPDGEVFPTNPSKIKMKFSADGSGSGLGWDWLASAPGGPAVSVDVMFSFVPDQSATYSLTAVFAFHGFYVLQADDGLFTSKSASVSIWFSLDTFQFFDRGPKSFLPNPFYRRGENINEFDNFDNILNFSDTQTLRQGEPVVVTANVGLNAEASGSGSHAEINFEDGDANYIQPLYLWVARLSG